MRRAVDLERLGEVGDLLGLVEAVPDHVHRGDVHPARLEVRPEVTAPVQVLSRADGHRRDVPDVRERPGIEHVDLQPEQVEGLQRPGDPDAAFRLEVEVEIHDRPGCAVGTVPERLEQAHEGTGDLGGLQRAPALGEARMQHLRLVARDDDVRLEHRVPPLDDLATERGDVVVGAELRRSGHLPGAGAGRPAMRPVHRDALARGPSEELVHGNPEGSCLEVEERVLDAGQGLRDHRAGALARRAVEIPVDRLDGPRVAADDERGEIFDDPRQARAATRASP